MRRAEVCLVFCVAGCGALVAPTRAAVPIMMTTTTTRNPAVRLLGMPANVVRGIWQRCTPDACTIGRPRPVAAVAGAIKSMLPRRRPLARLGRNECSVGIYKVERRSQGRHIVLFPFPRAKQECTVEDAMDMF